MQVPPDKAEEMFVRDLAPELAKDRGFHITHEQPGHLVFSDVPVESPGGLDTPRGASVEEIDLFARHIRVEFTPEGTGTFVKLHGHAEKDIRDAIDKLGTPDHWPEIADRPHD
jgi:uncharacterized protein YndB with AHSA1/START domain